MKNMEERKQEKQNIGKRIEDFFDKNYAFFFAPLIVAFLYIFARYGKHYLRTQKQEDFVCAKTVFSA